ncbi:MAG: hypothetical protein WCO56_05645 [Verrucomicrobiota bacterium]
MKRAIAALGLIVALFIVTILWCRWDSETNHGFSWGYWGQFNTVSNSLARLPGVTIVKFGCNTDVTMEEFALTSQQLTVIKSTCGLTRMTRFGSFPVKPFPRPCLKRVAEKHPTNRLQATPGSRLGWQTETIGLVYPRRGVSCLELFMRKNNRMVVGIAWYRPEQWTLMLSLIPNPEVFPNTYTEWLGRASNTLRVLSKQGFTVQKVDIDVKALLAWASELGRIPDGAARAEYAQYLIGKADNETGN